MSLLCCYVSLHTPVSHVSKPAGEGSIWATVVPGWITAIATAGLLIGATVTAVYAAKAFGKQAQEVGILLEQNKREAAERRRVQAARVFIGAPRDLVRLVHPYAQDASDNFPVSTMLSSGIPAWAACPSPMTSVRSCLANVSRVLIPSGPTTALARTILTFRDANGVRWVRMPDGALYEQSAATARESVLAILGLPLSGTPDHSMTIRPPAMPAWSPSRSLVSRARWYWRTASS